eukprot:876637_1
MGYHLSWTIGNVTSSCHFFSQTTRLRILVQNESKTYSVQPEFGKSLNLGTKYLPQWGNYTQFGYNCSQFQIGSHYNSNEAPFVISDFKFK